MGRHTLSIFSFSLHGRSILNQTPFWLKLSYVLNDVTVNTYRDCHTLIRKNGDKAAAGVRENKNEKHARRYNFCYQSIQPTAGLQISAYGHYTLDEII